MQCTCQGLKVSSPVLVQCSSKSLWTSIVFVPITELLFIRYFVKHTVPKPSWFEMWNIVYIEI